VAEILQMTANKLSYPFNMILKIRQLHGDGNFFCTRPQLFPQYLSLSSNIANMQLKFCYMFIDTVLHILKSWKTMSKKGKSL